METKRSKSGWWITWFLFTSVLFIFPLWEWIQLKRGKQTMSMYVINRAEQGSKFYRATILVFPVLVVLVGLWLLPHWEGLCIVFNVWCGGE